MARHITEGLTHRKESGRGHPKAEKASKTPESATSSLGDLSAEEQAVIRKMRQKKEAVEYTVDPFSELKILSPSRTISNNIFTVTFQGPASGKELEAFMTDPDGKPISGVKEFVSNGASQKVTFTLQSSSGYDPKARYFLISREKGAETQVLLKEPYTINISFVSDFDF